MAVRSGQVANPRLRRPVRSPYRQDMPQAVDRRERSQQAEQAWQRLPSGGSEQAALRIMCAASHHVATVYRTDAGLVYRSEIRRHSHGDRDLPDTPHGTSEPKPWFDLLEIPDADADDGLPAWCECGQRLLSRQAVRQWVADGEHRVVLD